MTWEWLREVREVVMDVSSVLLIVVLLLVGIYVGYKL